MPPWVEAKIRSGRLDEGTDWQPHTVVLSKEFRSLMPSVSRAIDSGVAYTALFPAVRTPEWAIPAQRHCHVFIQTKIDVVEWFLGGPSDHVVPEASQSLALFIRELGVIVFESTGCLGRGFRLDNEQAEGWIDAYLTCQEVYFEDFPTAEIDRFPCSESLFVADCGEGDVFVEHQNRIYSLSPGSDDMRIKDLAAGPGLRFKESMGAYSSEVIQTFADLANRMVGLRLGWFESPNN